jgi:hypothetical protein
VQDGVQLLEPYILSTDFNIDELAFGFGLLIEHLSVDCLRLDVVAAEHLTFISSLCQVVNIDYYGCH